MLSLTRMTFKVIDDVEGGSSNSKFPLEELCSTLQMIQKQNLDLSTRRQLARLLGFLGPIPFATVSFTSPSSVLTTGDYSTGDSILKGSLVVCVFRN